MTRSRRLLVVLCLCSLCLAAAAQPRDANKPGPPNPAAGPIRAKDLEAPRLARERREHALSLLISLGTEAGTFEDQLLRARTQSRIADSDRDCDGGIGRKEKVEIEGLLHE